MTAPAPPSCSSLCSVVSTQPKHRPRLASMQHRVLIYLTCYNVLDGVTLTIRKLEQEILAAGHSVCILTTISGDSNNTHLDGEHPNRQVIFLQNSIPIPFLDDPNHPEHSYHLGFSLSKQIKKQLDDFEPSMVHITVPDCTSLHIIQYARDKELPIMGTYHSNIPEYMEHYPGLSWLKHILGAFFRHQYNFLQALYVPTPFIQRHLIDNYKMDRITNLKVWGRGVDVQAFSPDYRSYEYRRSLGIDDTTPVLLWVGRLVPEKRPDIFCSVVHRLHARGLNFHALVVGAGPCEPQVTSLPNTTFCGWMSSQQLSTAYASSDVFLFPSAVETFGNVTLEAAASGLPVVVESGCSGHLVNEGENGFTADAGDEDGFFEHTLALIEDANLRQEQSRNGRSLALSLEKQTVVRQMLQNYNDITDEFYQEYSGRHFNRDAAYTQPESFVSGKYPRPCVLILVEYIFVALFSFCFNLTYVYHKISNALRRMSGRSRPAHTTITALGPTTLSRTGSFSAPNSGSSTTTAASATLHSKKGVCAKKLASKTDSVPSAPNPANNNSGNLSVIELDDVEIGPKEPLLGTADDHTATTSNSSQETSSSSSFGDCRLSHTLAKAFIHTVYMQARIESNLRGLTGGVLSSTPFSGKRKNSSVMIPVDEGRVERGRSERLLETEHNPHEGSPLERTVMRRNQSTVLDVY